MASPESAWALIQTGGVIAVLLIILFFLVTRRIITRGEFDNAMAEKDKQFALVIAEKDKGFLMILAEKDRQIHAIEGPLNAAQSELRKQAETNARLVEFAFQQRSEAQTIRREQKVTDSER